MSEFLRSVSFREKTIWVSAAIMTFMWVWYIDAVGASLFDGTVTRGGTIGIFIGMTVMVIFLHVASYIVLALTSPKQASQPEDERDRQINQRAESHAAWMLGAGVIMISMLTMYANLSGAAVVHLLLLLMIGVEVISNGMEIFYYRRGM